MKYKVSGMFQCDVEADTDAEAEWEAITKIEEGDLLVHIIDIEKEE